MPRDLESLTSLLLDRQIALHLAQSNRDAAMLRVWDWSDADAIPYLDSYNDAVEAAERKVVSVKEVIGWLTPSSYATNYGR